MKRILLYFLIIIVVVNFAASQVVITEDQNNLGVRIIQPTTTTSTSSGSAGANVSSVTSSTNCITVSPTTGDVIITFNASCSLENQPWVRRTGDNMTGSLTINTSSQSAFQILNGTGIIFNINGSSNGRITLFGTTYTGVTGASTLVGSSSPTLTTPAISQLRGGSAVNNNITIVPSSAVINNSHIVFRGNFTSTSPIWQTINATEVTVYIPLKTNSTINATYFIGDGSRLTNVSASMTNIFNQDLNTTNNVQFVNLTLTDRFLSTVAGASGVWHSYYVLGTALEVGRITSELGVFQVKSLANLPIYFSNDDTTGFFGVFDNGELVARNNQGKSFKVDDGTNTFFETNNTKTTVSGNLTLKGTYNDWAVSNGRINATGVNITSNHQTYNYTNPIAMDTTYTNTYERPIDVFMDFQISLTTNDDGAWMDGYVNGRGFGREGMGRFNTGTDVTPIFESYHQIRLTAQPGDKYSFNSSLVGTSTVSVIRSWRRVV